jgi:hypothetical protein
MNMVIQFATCGRREALAFLQKACPTDNITDTAECASPVLDLVEKDILRVQDPMMHGSRIAIIAGKKYGNEHDESVASAVKVLTDHLASVKKQAAA